MTAPLDFASLLSLYDRNPPYLLGRTYRFFVQHNAGIVTSVVGGASIALEDRLAFDPRADYWYLPHRRLLVAYVAAHWWVRWRRPLALRPILLRTARYFDRWAAESRLVLEPENYDAAGGWASAARKLREALEDLPDMPEWADVVAGGGRSLPPTFREHYRQFLDDTIATTIDDQERGYIVRLSAFPYCGATDAAELARRTRFWHAFAHAFTTTNSYRRAGSQFFAPMLQNTSTTVFLDALEAWRNGTPANKVPLLTLDGGNLVPRDRSGVNVVAEIWGMLNAHRAPFYNARAAEYRQMAGDAISDQSGAYEITLAVGSLTRRWLAGHDRAREALAAIATRDLAGQYPTFPFVQFEAQTRKPKTTREMFAPGAVDPELHEALRARARAHIAGLPELDQAALALHLLLDAHVYKQSVEADDGEIIAGNSDDVDAPEDVVNDAELVSTAREGGTALDRALFYPTLWVYAPGHGADQWEEHRREGIAAIGWNELGDLRRYASKEELASAMVQTYDPAKRPIHNATTCWDFAHRVAVGDTIIAKKGLRRIVGIGVVTSAYRHEPDREPMQQVIGVDWLWSGEHAVKGRNLPMKTLTNISNAREIRKQLAELVSVRGEAADERLAEIEPANAEAEAPDPYAIADALEDLFLDKAELEHLVGLLARKKNLVLQGPPGVGKTFVAKRLAYLLMAAKDETRSAFVQFHQAYTYEAFVQGFRPASGGGFELRHGPFLDLAGLARSADADEAHVLVIDEINRGNLGKILGELMMLIEPDKRDERWAIRLPHSKNDETFYVPENLHIIGTMNTADRSLAVVDYALRRRFVFFELRPAWGRARLNAFLERNGLSPRQVERLTAQVGAVNRQIREDPQLGRGFEIGHSYFCAPAPDAEAWIADVYRYEILPLLEEYWFDAPGQLAEARAHLGFTDI